MSITITIPLAVPRVPRLLEDPAKLLLAVGEPCLVLLAGVLGLGPIGQTLVVYGLGPPNSPRLHGKTGPAARRVVYARQAGGIRWPPNPKGSQAHYPHS